MTNLPSGYGPACWRSHKVVTTSRVQSLAKGLAELELDARAYLSTGYESSTRVMRGLFRLVSRNALRVAAMQVAHLALTRVHGTSVKAAR